MRGLLLAGVLFAVAGNAGAQFRLGGEFQVNTATAGHQSVFGRSVARDAAGNFVVAWETYPPSDSDVFTQRFDARGKRRGAEFRVNVSTLGGHSNPRVVMRPSGDFVVVWTRILSGAHSILARRFDPSGAAVGAEFRVDTTPGTPKITNDVALDPDGNFAVVWHAGGQEPGLGVRAQRFDPNGTPVGAELRVNTYTTSDQKYGAIGFGGDGRFVVTWSSISQDGSGYGVFGQRFDDTGTQVGAEFQVNDSTPGDQNVPSIGAADDGRFVVTWTGRAPNRGIFAQSFDPSGNRVGAEFQVNTVSALYPVHSVVGVDRHGNFVVVWATDNLPDDDGWGIRARVFTPLGMSDEVAVNTYTPSIQVGPGIALGDSGAFVVTWKSLYQDGSQNGVFAQRMNAGIIPSAGPVDAAAVGVDGGAVDRDEDRDRDED